MNLKTWTVLNHIEELWDPLGQRGSKVSWMCWKKYVASNINLHNLIFLYYVTFAQRKSLISSKPSEFEVGDANEISIEP